MSEQMIVKKTFNIGRDKIGRKIDYEVEIRQTKEGPEFSMCGNYWNKPHTDIIMGGQCCDDLIKEIHTFVIPRKKVLRMVAVWKKYHLNGMNPGCKHQRDLHWEDIRIDPKELPKSTANRDERGIIASWIYPLESLQDTGYFKEGIWIEVKKSPFVDIKDCHKNGVLTKPCPICGYRYGTKWIYEKLPDKIIEEVKGW